MEEDIDVTDSSTEEEQSTSSEKDYKTMYENNLRALREARAINKNLSSKSEIPDIEKIVEKKLNEATKTRYREDLEAIIAEQAETDEEKQAIMKIYDTRINPSGFSMTAMKRDIEDARILALRGRTTDKDKAKLKASIAEEKAMKSSSGRVEPVVEEEGEKKFSDDERAFLTTFTGIKH